MHKPRVRVRATARPDRARARRDDVRRDGSQRSFTDASAMYIHKFYNNLKLQPEQRVYASLHGYTARVDTRRCDADIYMLLFTFDYMESVFAVHHMHMRMIWRNAVCFCNRTMRGQKRGGGGGRVCRALDAI